MSWNSIDPFGNLSDAAKDVIHERVRQITLEGWSARHDDSHKDGSLALAAATYAYSSTVMGNPPSKTGMLHALWPKSWAPKHWKPKTRRHDLVRAGALIIAEIERLDRAGGR